MKIAFDFDMTLADSSSGVFATLVKSFQETSIQMADNLAERFKSLRGQKLDAQLSGFSKELLNEEQLGCLMDSFKFWYPEIGVDGTELFPHVTDVFQLLQSRGVEVHIVSAKSSQNLKLTMSKLGIFPSAWIGGVFGMEKSRYLGDIGCTTYIGDLELDVEVARQTPCQAIIINNSNEDLRNWISQPDLVFRGTTEFFHWLKIPENFAAL